RAYSVARVICSNWSLGRGPEPESPAPFSLCERQPTTLQNSLSLRLYHEPPSRAKRACRFVKRIYEHYGLAMPAVPRHLIFHIESAGKAESHIVIAPHGLSAAEYRPVD